MSEETTDETRDEAAARLFRTDPTLAPYVERHGVLELDPAEDLFQRLVVSLLRQQVSIDAAAAIRERLFDRFVVTPERLRRVDAEALRAVGLSAAKADYVQAVAAAFDDRSYSRSFFSEMSDDAVLSELTDIRGVGPWTGKMFLLFALGRPDVFPVEDLGVRRSMELVCEREMTRAEMRERAREWRPYRSYASLYLWQAYEG